MNLSHVPGRPLSSARLLAWRLAQIRSYRAGAPLATSPGAALRRYAAGAGAAEDPQNYITDPNLEAGTGTKTYSSLSPTGGSLAGGSVALPSPNTAVYGSTYVQVSTPDGVNMRSSSNVNSTVVAIEPNGTLLTVTGQQQSGWLPVLDGSGKTGWVYSAYVVDASGNVGAASADQGSAQSQSVSPAIMGSTTAASDTASSGALGVLMMGGALTIAYYLLVK